MMMGILAFVVFLMLDISFFSFLFFHTLSSVCTRFLRFVCCIGFHDIHHILLNYHI